MTGILLAAAAAFFWGAGQTLARLGLQHIKPSTATLISVISSLALVGSLALIINLDAILAVSLMAVLWFGLIGIINFGMGRQFTYLSIKYIGVTKTSPIMSTNPLFAMVLAVIFIGETVNALIVLGTLCVVFGLSLVVTSQ